MKTYRRLATAAAALLASISIAAFAEEARDYLPPEKAAEVLADGVPWSAAAPNGRNFKLTLNKDGTGSVRGGLPFTMSITWTIKGEAMCLSGTMMAKCLRFQETPGGIQSWDGDKPDLKLSR